MQAYEEQLCAETEKAILDAEHAKETAGSEAALRKIEIEALQEEETKLRAQAQAAKKAAAAARQLA